MKAKKFTALIAALAMIISILPTSLITASADEDPIRITSMRFRAHPQTYSIFDKSTEIPTNLLWTEFNTTIDHSQDYNKTTRTYHIGDGYYQIEIFRPEHGPAGQTHPEASIVPENDISGIVKDEIEENKTHRYHGWKIGEHEDDTLFQRDDTIPYQVGEYTAKLQKLETTEAPESFDATKTLPKQAVSEKSIKLVHVTYTLSEQDKSDGYKLKCPMEENPALEIKELAMVGDMPAVIAPKADSTNVVTEGTKKVISGWKVVKDKGGTQLSGPIGDYIPEDGKPDFADEDSSDNQITLQAIFSEPKSFAYDITTDEEGAESAFPSVPDSTPAPASFNKLVNGGEEDKKIEYDPTGAAEPLTLYIINKGNQREHIQVSDSSVFNFKLENVNTETHAQDMYENGGLNDYGSGFYIPSNADVQKAQEQYSETWKNYAKLIITPKNGLSVGSHTAEIKTRCYNNGARLWNVNTLTIDISKKTVKIAPENTEKEYGQTLTDANIMCDVYDSAGESLIEENKTAAELGVKITSDGMSADATIGNGDKGDNRETYSYKLAEGQSNSNYDVTLKDGLETGITVTKTTPRFNNVSASLIKDGNTLSQSKLKGDYVNKNSHKTVDGEWKWVDENEVINEHLEDGTTKVITRQYQFTPTDTTHYDTPQPGTVNITVSGLRDVKLSATGKTLTKTYNGQPQAPSFSWARGSDGPREDQITVKYKKVEDSDTSFKEDEDYSQYQEVAPTDAGIYKVYATCPAYNNMFAAGVATAIFTINPYPLELNLSGSVVDKMYDGTKTAKIDASKVTFKQKPTAEDDVRVKAEAFTTAEFDSKSFDPYYPKTVRVVVKGEGALEGNDAKNYILNDTTLSTTGRIMWQRPVKLELKKPITKKYGTAYTITSDDYRVSATGQPSSGGLVEGETVDAVRATVTALKNGIDGTSAEATVGDYEVTASVPNASDYNYSVTNDPLGTLTVEKADPTPEGAVTAENGKTGNKLSTVKLDGTFINSNNVNMSVGGDLEWEEPDTLLEEGTKSYKWTFTPTDTANYNPISGSVDVTATEKEPAPIALTVPENVTYNGQQHAATATSTVDEAQITIEYAKNEDIELHTMSLPDEELTWQQIPPKEAGTYYVRATVQAIGDYAQNEEIKSMTILQAEPVGTVTAGSVDRGAYLSDSRLTYSFTGVDDTPLTGSAQWSSQGANPPTEITVDPDTEYTWEFDPEDNNYKTVTGTAKVEINVDTRKAEAKIYNLPKDYDTIGDYAYVNVDGTNLKAGDTVQFYADESGPNPESKAFDITDEMHGWTLVNLDDDALKAEGGMLYLNIKGSSEATKVDYKPEIGFIINPTQIYIKVNDTADVSVTPSDNSYVVNSVTWTAEPETTATVQGTAADNGMTAKVTGVDDGVASLTATAVFKHPDTENKPNATITLTKPATVTVTEEQAPDYTYTTNAATNVTATGATLKGHVEIKTYGTSITPKAVCLFEIWKKGSSDEKRSIGKDSQQTLTQSGDYDFTLDDLEPNTTYEYRAIGIAGNTMTPGEPQEFTTEKAAYAVTFYSDEEDAVITVDGSPLGADKTVTKTDGEKLTFTVTPPAGMVIADVLANGVSLTANEEDGSYGITVDKDYNVWLSFKKATHTVTFRNDEGAVITVDGAPLDADNTVIKNEGDKLTFTVEVPEGLELVGVTANGDALAAKEDGSYEITVDKDYEIAFSYRNKVIENVETEITSVEVTANGATVGSVRARNGLLIVASYTADNKLMDVNTKQLALSKDETTDMIALNTVGAASVKAFIWDSMLHPEPLCEPKSETVTSE